MSEPLIQTPGVFGENDNFLLERELGSGGMGGVYMGRDKMLDRPVAVKVMLKEYGDDAEFIEKFKKEAQSVARLIHPNIAQIYSYGICKGMPYMAMELAAGGSLYSLLNANPGKVDIPRVIKICQQVAQALQCASDLGFVHGDVKPENVLLDANGNAKLVDFGLAAMQKNTDEIWGTPYYISPEKVRKEPVDFRSDMYSLGGTLYHALTGVAPFEGDDSIAVIKKRFEGAPKKPSEIRPDITPAIDKLVLKMLSLNKEDRYPSFEALIEAFKDVLTNGLTVGEKGDSATEAAQKGSASGTRRMTTVHNRRMTTLRRQTASIKKKSAGDGENDDVVELTNSESEEEESGGNLGAKVVGMVFGIILLIAAVAGGLIWYKIANEKSRANDEKAQITAGIEKARASISKTMSAARDFADEFDAYSKRAIDECQKPTDKLVGLLPEDLAAQLKPEPTQELLDAIASTNEAVAAAAKENAKDDAGAAVAKAMEKLPEAMKEAIAAMPKFREPNEDEKDPASPEGQDYAKARKEFMEEQMKKIREKLSNPQSAETAASSDARDAVTDDTSSAGDKKVVAEYQLVIQNMSDLWIRAYGCQACAIRIRKAANQILDKGAEANALRDMTLDNMKKLEDLSREVVDMHEKMTGSPDVMFVRKGISVIKNKGASLVSQTIEQIRLRKLKEERDAAAAAAAAAEIARKKELEEKRKAKIEEETTAARTKFDAIVTQGCFRQLDWKSAFRMLNVLKEGMTTPEGQLATDLEIRKVNDMKMVQDRFIANLKGHVFKGKLKTCKVEDVNEKELVIYKPGNQGKIRIAWQKFYRDYPGNLHEIMNAYVVNSRLPGAKNRITSLLEWANLMTGAALTMQLVCGEVNGAIQRSEMLVKAIVNQFPEYEKTAKEIFPNISLDEAKEEE